MDSRIRNTLGLILRTHVALATLVVWSVGGCADDTDAGFVIGPTHTLAIDVPPGAADPTVVDPATGLVFAFPEGGRGEIAIAPIVSGPAAPFPGQGYYLALDPELFAELVLPGADDGSRERPMLFGHATTIEGIFDDEPGRGPRWVALPWRAMPDALAFELTLPLSPPLNAPLSLTSARASALTTPAPSTHYWIAKIDKDSSDADKRQLLSLQLGDYRDAFLTLLRPERRVVVEALRAEAPLTLEHDGNYYKGFWWRSLGSLGRSYRPTVHVTLDGFSLAHELSHHLVHLLVGHDVQSRLEGQASFFASHAIRDHIGRASLVEDHAYFVEYLLTGKGGSYDLAVPHLVLGGLAPSGDEIPGTEGFGALMLTALLDASDSMRDAIHGELAAVPPSGLTTDAVLELVARGATDIDTLRGHVFEALGEARATVRLHRLGWRYSVRGKLVDEARRPIAGARVSTRKTVGDIDYDGVRGEVVSDVNGNLRIGSDAFGGDSLLVVRRADDREIALPIRIAWTHLTTSPVEVGELVVPDAPAPIAGTYHLDVDGDGCGEGYVMWFYCTLVADAAGVLTQTDDCALAATVTGSVSEYSAHIEWVVAYTDLHEVGRYDGSTDAERRVWTGSASYTLTYSYAGTEPRTCSHTARVAELTYTGTP